MGLNSLYINAGPKHLLPHPFPEPIWRSLRRLKSVVRTYRVLRMSGEKVPKDIVRYDAWQRIRKSRVIGRFRWVIHWDAIPGMLTTYELIKRDCVPAVADRSISLRHTGQSSRESGAERARRRQPALIRLSSGPIAEHLILRQEAVMGGSIRDTAHV